MAEFKKGDESAFPEIKSDSEITRDNGEADAHVVSNVWSEGGLSKRELFAALCMQGYLSTLTIGRDEFFGACAESAVKAADALLAELQKERGE